MLVEKTNVYVSNVNARKEGSGDNMPLALDIKVAFDTPRSFIDRLVPDQKSKFSDQFFTETGDVRLAQLFPIRFYQKIEDLSVGIYMGKKPTHFRPSKMTSIELTPQGGGYVNVSCTLQVYPTAVEAGKLDMLIKEVVPIEIDTLNKDIDDAGADATNVD